MTGREPESAVVHLSDEEVLSRFTSLRQHQQDGKRSPHKPLLVLTALGRLLEQGSSATPFSAVEAQLASLIKTFGRPSRTAAASAAAYPFTRLRSDGIWQLSSDVPMDEVTPLRERGVVGRFTPEIESALLSSDTLVWRLARFVVDSQFPDTLASDVLLQAGIGAELVFHTGVGAPVEDTRRRSTAWVADIMAAWNRQCAFCGYDGQLGDAQVGLEAAHVRWFKLGGPDSPDNGLALCSLHHKLFDRGALGIDPEYRVKVSTDFVSRTPAGQAVFDLHGAPLRPRPGAALPSSEYVAWNDREVFKGRPLAV